MGDFCRLVTVIVSVTAYAGGLRQHVLQHTASTKQVAQDVTSQR